MTQQPSAEAVAKATEFYKAIHAVAPFVSTKSDARAVIDEMALALDAFARERKRAVWEEAAKMARLYDLGTVDGHGIAEMFDAKADL